MNTPTLYLMSKYTGREAESLKENQDAWLMLHRKGYLVYSPICESHNIEERRKAEVDLECRTDTRCVDCKYYDNGDCNLPKDCKYYEEPDYVARDLQLLESWCIEPEYIYDKDEFENPIREINPKWTQPKVVGVVLPSAVVCNCGGCGTNYFREVKPPYISCCPERHLVLGWKSKGALKEYEFMQSHHILCITLETALTVPPEQWSKYSL
jgi:hypothetical protein